MGRLGLVYARVSSKKQETEGSGLESQESRCRQYLMQLEVPHKRSFHDSYTGGGDFMQRPAMRELLGYIDAHPHEKFVVVFDDLKRFARDTEFHLKLRSAFKARDVILHCLNFNFDDSPEGRFAETVFAAQAELERHQNRRQVIQKMKARLELGYWPFGVKRGYNIVRDRRHGKISVPNEDAQIIRVALEDFASGKLPSQLDVAKHFAAHEFWGKPKPPEVYLSRVKKILQDSFYCGWIEYPPWDVKCLAGNHEPLISGETYLQIQKRLKRPASEGTTRKDMSSDFPLRGLLLCPRCTRSLTGAWAKKKYAYYYCPNRDCPCRNKTSSTEDAEQDFRKLMERLALRSEAEPLVNLTFNRVWKEEINAMERNDLIVASRKKALEQKVVDLTELARKASSDKVRQAYEAQIERTVAESEAIEMPTGNNDLSVPYQTALSKSMGLLKNPYIVWKDADVQEKRNLFFLLFEDKLTYSKTTGFQTGDSLSTTRLFDELVATNSSKVDPSGFEPLAFGVQNRRSTK